MKTDKIIPIAELTPEDKACEVLKDVDFTTEADMIKAISNVAELIRKHEQQHDQLAEKLVENIKKAASVRNYVYGIQINDDQLKQAIIKTLKG